jgi:hypothetical protein
MSESSNNRNVSRPLYYSTRNLAAPSNNQDLSITRPPSSPVSRTDNNSRGRNKSSVLVQHNASTPSMTAAERLQEYNSSLGKTKSTVQSEVVDPEEAMLIQCLALQAYHLPGNSWRQDWTQYMLNNHPILGVFCHHPKHPIKACTRLVALVGTVVVGLAITNLFYLFCT